MKAYKVPKISIKEYIDLERTTDTRYEYHNGEVFALAGGTINHGKLCGNIYTELRSKLKANNAKCSAYTGEIKLRIEAKNTYVYPDSIVICGAINTSDEDKNAVTNPVLIVEVLSKSTSDYDRGDKFFLYRQIPSLKEYVLIEQEKAVVEVYFKKEGKDIWQITRFEGIDSILSLQSLNITIPLAELYFDIDSLAS